MAIIKRILKRTVKQLA